MRFQCRQRRWLSHGLGGDALALADCRRIRRSSLRTYCSRYGPGRGRPGPGWWWTALSGVRRPAEALGLCPVAGVREGRDQGVPSSSLVVLAVPAHATAACASRGVEAVCLGCSGGGWAGACGVAVKAERCGRSRGRNGLEGDAVLAMLVEPGRLAFPPTGVGGRRAAARTHIPRRRGVAAADGGGSGPLVTGAHRSVRPCQNAPTGVWSYSSRLTQGLDTVP